MTTLNALARSAKRLKRMTYYLNNARNTAVSSEAEFLPMSSCPRGVKVILLGAGGVATIGQYDGKDPFWKGWHPMLRKPKEKK